MICSVHPGKVLYREVLHNLGEEDNVVVARDEYGNVELDDQGNPRYTRILEEYDCFPMSDLSEVAREEVENSRKARARARQEAAGQSEP